MNGVLGILVAVAWASALGPALAQATDSAATRARLAAVVRAYQPGLMGAVLVARGDEVLLDSGYGKANLEWGLDNAPDVKFRIGSLTKQFTAALVLLLRQDGKLDLADPVTKYLPGAPKAWAAVTLTELLDQTSGIPDFTRDKRFSDWSMATHAPAEELAFFQDRPLEFTPGSKFEYSNSNYEVLGAVMEKVSGRSYADLLGARILRPLGLNDTGLDSDELILARRAQGYKPGKTGLEKARSESMTVPWAAGGMYSTTDDLYRWERALFGGKLLTPASLTLMTTPGMGDYGLGLLSIKRDGERVIWHNGGIEGFHAFLAYEPQGRITTVVLSNVERGLPDVVGTQLLDVAAGRHVFLEGEQKSAPIPAAQLARFEGSYALSPDGTLTFARKGDALVLTVGERSATLLYEGERGGHPTFFAPGLYLDIEFVAGPNGAITSAVLHQGLEGVVADRK